MGRDADGRVFWNFADTQLYAESVAVLPKGQWGPGAWATVCRVPGDWTELAASLAKSKNPAQRDLRSTIVEVLAAVCVC